MNPFYVRILDDATLNAGDAQPLSEAVDLARYRELEVVVHVTGAADGDTPTLILEHSVSSEEGTYLAFSTPVEVDLGSTGSSWFHQGAFTRWVAWRLGGTLSSSATVTLELLAKP